MDINTASIDQLKSIDGLGEARARDIVRYRESKGEFKSWNDVKKVPGINDEICNLLQENGVSVGVAAGKRGGGSEDEE